MESFTAGTLAGAGSFRCEGCGFAIALHELDEVPSCPECGGERFSRASLFERPTEVAPTSVDGEPDWLAGARDALVSAGDYLAFEDGDRVRVAQLREGCTRLGRSPAADVHLDDPTVSRRHAVIRREQGRVELLDDRSLNGVFLNGARCEWSELADGDEIVIGRYRLYFLRRDSRERAAAAVANAKS